MVDKYDLKFPNTTEKEILDLNQKQSTTIKQKLKFFVWKHPKINYYCYEYIRKHKFVQKTHNNSLNYNTVFPDPNFMICGFPKCGTTSLWNYLGQHPQILSSAQKELHFFSYDYVSNLNLYKSYFPRISEKNKRNLLIFEASQSYMIHPTAMERISKKYPKMKFIICLRNPVEQVFSAYNMSITNGFEIKSLEECLNDEKNRHSLYIERVEKNLIKPYTYGYLTPYLHNAEYITHIKTALKYFPKENFLFIENYDLKHNTQETVSNCFNFLNLDKIKINPKIHNKGNYKKINKELESRLSTHFVNYDIELNELMDKKLSWL
jgi:hypothetical protein